jgi:hypothetical protein
MAIRKINVGKCYKNPTLNSKQTKPFTTEKMFKDLDQLLSRKKELEKKKKEVIVNEKLLTLQYR